MNKTSQKRLTCPKIGILAVKKGLISKEQLRKSLSEIASAPEKISALSDYFLSQNWITQEHLDQLLKASKTFSLKKHELKFGAIAIRKGFITKKDFGIVLKLQSNAMEKQQKRIPIGDMLVQNGMMTAAQRNETLKIQNHLIAQHQSANQKTSKATKNKPDPLSKNNDEIKPAGNRMRESEMLLPGVKVQVSMDNMLANLFKTDEFDENLTVSDIKAALSEHGIVSGIVIDDMIQGFLNSGGVETKPFRVAKGRLPIKGRDAKLTFLFDTDHLKIGGISTDGSIDFKKRGDLPIVEAGTLLVEKTPMVQSKDGENILGVLLETAIREDIDLWIGDGTYRSQDGNKLFAKVRGYPKYTMEGVVSVNETYTIKGDVDYETGHVKYGGNVDVAGRIKPGFQVSGNDVTALELEGGVVKAQGAVLIRGGINEGTVYAKGDVYAHFIHSSKILCMGNVIVMKEIVDSTIESVGACMIPNGKIIASKLITKMGCSTQHLGTEMTNPCSVHIGHDSFTEKEFLKIEKRMTKFNSRLSDLEEELVTYKKGNAALQKRVNELAHIQDRSQLEKNKLEQERPELNGEVHSEGRTAEIEELENTARNAEKELDQCFDKSNDLEKQIAATKSNIQTTRIKIEKLKTEKKNLGKWAKNISGIPVIVVVGAIQAGTIIKGLHTKLVIKKTVRHVKLVEGFEQHGPTGAKGHEIQMKSI